MAEEKESALERLRSEPKLLMLDRRLCVRLKPSRLGLLVLLPASGRSFVIGATEADAPLRLPRGEMEMIERFRGGTVASCFAGDVHPESFSTDGGHRVHPELDHEPMDSAFDSYPSSSRCSISSCVSYSNACSGKVGESVE